MRDRISREDEAYILGDWGTSNLRVYLHSKAGGLLQTLEGQGIGRVRDQAAPYFFKLVEPWRRKYGHVDITLSGMVGSNIGWLETPYVDCPATKELLCERLSRFSAMSHNIAIVPGLKTCNPFDAPDVMRGEESQVVGALALEQGLRVGRHVLCLPGTHTKWVLVEDGRVQTFFTTISGELFALFRKHSVLVDWHEEIDPEKSATWEQGMARAEAIFPSALLHIIFEVRSRQLAGQLTRPEAVSYLSGLIIGRDIAGSLPVFEDGEETPGITVVGASRLAGLYASGCARQNREARVVDGEQALLAGLNEIRARVGKEI